MDRIIEVKVGGNHLSKDNKNAGVKGEANVTRLRITFDESWDSYAKTVTFWDALGKNPVKRTLTTNYLENIVESTRIYLVPIPAEPMAEAGTLTFVIDGYISGKRQRSMSDVLVVKDAPITDNAAEPTDPTPTQAEQLQEQIDQIKDDIQDVTVAASEAEYHANNAEQSAKSAGNYKLSAQVHRDDALKHANDAITAANKAEELQGQIEQMHGDVQEAVVATGEAKKHADDAKQYAESAESSKMIAGEYKDTALVYANDAKLSAEGAENCYVMAGEYKDNALEHSNNALSHANDAMAAANKAEEAITHNPIIIDGYWHIWAAKSECYIDTKIKAQSGSTVYVGDNPPADADVWVYPDGEGSIIEQTYTPESENAQSGRAVAEALTTIKVPTNVSELKNDKGYLTEHQDISGKADKDHTHTAEEVGALPKDTKIPSKVSELVNDKGYITELSDVSGKVDKSYVDDEIANVYYDMSYKADKTDIYYDNDSYPVYGFGMSHNVETRYEEVSSISFVFDDGEYSDDYISGLSFDSGSTPTSIDYTDSGILNWVGTDCTTSDGLSIFQPSEDTHYDIVFYFNGWQFVGLVNGYVPATGNGAV